MLSKVFRIILCLALVGAAVFLATKAAAEHSTLRVIAAVVVTLPAGLVLWRELGEILGAPSSQKRNRVKRSLQSGLMEIYRDKAIPAEDDITQVSFHVWVLPTWYRRLGPVIKWWRRRRKHSEPRQRLRPKLVRLAMFRFDHMPSSEISFRPGIGLVGRCIALNKPKDVLVVRFNSKRFQQALGNDDAWKNSEIEIHQNLRRRDAQKLAGYYRQVAATVIREHSGDPIGCVTLELPKGAKAKFKKPKQHGPDDDPLLRQLHLTAHEVERDLWLKIGLQA